MKNLRNKMNTVMLNMMSRKFWKQKLSENDGQFVMDNAVVFVVIIVIAGIALALLTNFLQTDMAPTLKEKILAFFN